MHLLTTLSLLALSALSSVSAAPTDNKYTEVMGKVTFSPTRQCPLTDTLKSPSAGSVEFIFPANTESNHCRTFYAGAVYQSLDMEFLDPKCQLTVYNSYNCSDAGVVSGMGGCWSPEGGVRGYRVSCPWKY